MPTSDPRSPSYVLPPFSVPRPVWPPQGSAQPDNPYLSLLSSLKNPNAPVTGVPYQGPYSNAAYDQAQAAYLQAQGQQQQLGNLLNLISIGEGTSQPTAQSHGFPSGYDVPYGNGRLAIPDKPISQMTLGEVDALQSEMHNNPENTANSSAVGRYQIEQSTLQGLRNADENLTDDTVFSPDLQDELARRIVAGEGLQSYANGTLPHDVFYRNLQRQWTSIGDPQGLPPQSAQILNQATNDAIQGLGPSSP